MNKQALIKHWDVIEAFKDGKEVEYYCGDGRWYDVKDGSTFSEIDTPHRIKTSWAQAYRPWSLTEVPIGALIRRKLNPSEEAVILAVSVTASFPRILVSPSTFEKPSSLFISDLLTYHGGNNIGDRMEYSTDYGKTWHPCGVEL